MTNQKTTINLRQNKKIMLPQTSKNFQRKMCNAGILTTNN